MTGYIRAATTADAEAVAAIYAPYVRGTAISFEIAPPSAEEMASRIGSTLQRFPFLVYEDGQTVLAYAYAGAHRERAAYRWSADVTVYSKVHRRGLGRALYLELLSLLARQGFHMAFAGIALPNEKSVGFHEAMGFLPVGTYAEVGFKFDRWWDVGWWQRPLKERPPTGEPLSFSEL